MSQSTLGLQPAAKQEPGSKKPTFRPDIQGLRAVAVLLVIADHLFGYPLGGFIGVDIFFVISGFLITGLLVREQQKTGRISFADFYRRRVRRIIPLAVLVLATTVAASWALFPAIRAQKITVDGIWSFVFGANWHFALDGTDYMQADAAVSPLQHFWSLAVEEQFYVVWPWLVVLFFGVLASRLRWSPAISRIALAVAILAVSAASFLFAMWETATAPTVAYFSTFSRAWELGAGALLAVIAPVLHRLPEVLRSFLAYLGLAGIAACALLINPDTPFPGPWAVVPVGAAMLVIVAGTGGKQRHLYPLTNPVSRYLGDISYSLYLWHFPAIVLLGAVYPLDSPMSFAVILAVIIGLSALSYYFLEDAIRHSSWLEPKSKRRKSTRKGAERLSQGALVAFGLVTLIVVGAALAKTSQTEEGYVTAPIAAPLAGTGASAAPDTPASAWAMKINAALGSPTWPQLSPSIDALGDDARVPEWWQDGCLATDRAQVQDPIANADHCVYGSPAATKTAVVLGDSVAISYVPGIRAALEPLGFRVAVHTMAQCPVADVRVLKADGSAHTQCDTFRSWTFDNAAATSPDLIIATSAIGTLDRLASKATGAAAYTEFEGGFQRSLAKLVPVTEKVVWLNPPPGGKPLLECATKLSSPKDCVATVSQKFLDYEDAARKSVGALGLPNVSVVDSKPWFCSQNSCPAFVESAPVFADGAHLTAAFSSSMGELLGPVLSE
ncbi:acyltransferase family protein [Pseudarthrobacter sp. NPDC089323]